MRKIKVAAVSYLNTRPLVYGFARHKISGEMILTEDFPSKIAAQLKDGSVDIGLVPVAILPELPEYHIISDYCIGATGEVASVCIFSDVPIEAVQEVLLDYQSRTSVMLATILLKEYWNSKAKLVPATNESYRDAIRGTTAGVVIGDRAFEQRLRSKYIYDLGTAWKDHTGLPFVFATWVSNKILPETFLHQFNEATGEGLKHLEEIAKAHPYPHFDILSYFRDYISYTLDADKRAGLELFLQKLRALRQ